MPRPVDARRPHHPLPKIPGRNLLDRLTDDDMETLLDPHTPTTRREPNVVLLRKCPVCREWAQTGSFESGYSTCCGAKLDR